MSTATTGITAEVIRDIMPPYHLSLDLVNATFAALPAAPPEATTAWRHERIARLIEEISTLMPANARQARTAAQIVILQELADSIAADAHAPNVTAPIKHRAGRVSAELARTAAGLERLLERKQQKPAPFFGTMLADEIDIAAVDAAWISRTVAADTTPPDATPDVTPAPVPGPRPEPDSANATNATAPALANTTAPAAPVAPEPPADPPTEPPADASPTADVPRAAADEPATEAPAQRQPAQQPNPPPRSADAAAIPKTDARSTAEGVVTRLGQGHGWTLEVVRPRTPAAPSDDPEATN